MSKYAALFIKLGEFLISDILSSVKVHFASFTVLQYHMVSLSESQI